MSSQGTGRGAASVRRLAAAVLILAAGLVLAAGARADEDVPPVRLVNGYVVEGTSPQPGKDGLTLQTPKGSVTLPWKHLSAGTRNRYEAAGKAVAPAKPGAKPAGK